MAGAMKQESDGKIAALLTNIADGLGHLVSEHIALARIELTEDATALARSLGQALAFLSLVLVGYGFLCTALVAFLAPAWTSLPVALLIVGGANLIVGAIGAYGGLRRIAARRVMHETMEQLDRSKSVLEAVASSNAPEVVDGKRL